MSATTNELVACPVAMTTPTAWLDDSHDSELDRHRPPAPTCITVVVVVVVIVNIGSVR
jgi:hypothetical protein